MVNADGRSSVRLKLSAGGTSRLQNPLYLQNLVKNGIRCVLLDRRPHLGALLWQHAQLDESAPRPDGAREGGVRHGGRTQNTWIRRNTLSWTDPNLSSSKGKKY